MSFEFVAREAKTVRATSGITAELSALERPGLELVATTNKGESFRKDWERKRREYKVVLVHPDSRKEEVRGHIEVITDKVCDYRNTQNLHGIFASYGLEENEKVLVIDQYFPTGWHTVPDGLSHKGIGSAVMRQVLEDAALDGVAAVYCWSGRPHMADLLKKFDFITIEPDRYLKILKQKDRSFTATSLRQ